MGLHTAEDAQPVCRNQAPAGCIYACTHAHGGRRLVSHDDHRHTQSTTTALAGVVDGVAAAAGQTRVPAAHARHACESFPQRIGGRGAGAIGMHAQRKHARANKRHGVDARALGKAARLARGARTAAGPARHVGLLGAAGCLNGGVGAVQCTHEPGALGRAALGAVRLAVAVVTSLASRTAAQQHTWAPNLTAASAAGWTPACSAAGLASTKAFFAASPCFRPCLRRPLFALPPLARPPPRQRTIHPPSNSNVDADAAPVHQRPSCRIAVCRRP